MTDNNSKRFQLHTCTLDQCFIRMRYNDNILGHSFELLPWTANLGLTRKDAILNLVSNVNRT